MVLNSFRNNDRVFISSACLVWQSELLLTAAEYVLFGNFRAVCSWFGVFINLFDFGNICQLQLWLFIFLTLISLWSCLPSYSRQDCSRRIKNIQLYPCSYFMHTKCLLQNDTFVYMTTSFLVLYVTFISYVYMKNPPLKFVKKNTIHKHTQIYCNNISLKDLY